MSGRLGARLAAFGAGAGTTVVVAVCSGLFGVIATRTIGPFERGLFATASVWTAVLAVLLGAGLPQAVTYFAGRYPGRAAAFTGAAIALAATGGLVMSTLGVLIALVLGGEARAPLAVLLAAAAPMMATGCGLAAILGTSAYRAWAILRPVGPMASLVAIIIVVAAGGDTAFVVACVVAGSWVLHCAVVMVAVRRRGLLGPPNRSVATELVAYSWRQVVGLFAWLLTYKLDQLYLSVAATPTALGLYAVAATVGEVIVPVAASAGTIMLARAATGGPREASASLPLALGLCLAVAGPLCLGAAAVAGDLVSTVFGSDFLPATDALRIYLFGTIALAVATVLADTLRGLGYPLDPAKAEIPAALASIALLAALVPAHGIEGAAAASTTSYILAMGLLALLVRGRLRALPDIREAG